MVQDRIVLTRTSCLNPVTGGKNRKALLAIRSTVLSVLSFSQAQSLFRKRKKVDWDILTDNG